MFSVSEPEAPEEETPVQAVLNRLATQAPGTEISEEDLITLVGAIYSDRRRLQVFGMDDLSIGQLRDNARERIEFLREHFGAFKPILEKRPEIEETALMYDLWNYYLPYMNHLIELKKTQAPDKAFMVNTSAIQGAGKTTQGEILEVLFALKGYSAISRSVDDHYVTHKKLCEIREGDPRIIRRGVTHDIDLAVNDLTTLRNMNEGEVILISGYHKGAHSGDGDRYRWVTPQPGVSMKCKVQRKNIKVNQKDSTVPVLHLTEVTYQDRTFKEDDLDALSQKMGGEIPIAEGFLPRELIEFLTEYIDSGQDITVDWEEHDGKPHVRFEAGENTISVEFSAEMPTGWRVVTEPPSFIFYDGWMNATRFVEEEVILGAGNLPALETKEAREFALAQNRRLRDYGRLWKIFDHTVVLWPSDYTRSVGWRDDAEVARRDVGQGMNPTEIREFVHYFWTSNHPGLHGYSLIRDPRTDMVVVIGNNHEPGSVLLPTHVAELPDNRMPVDPREIESMLEQIESLGDIHRRKVLVLLGDARKAITNAHEAHAKRDNNIVRQHLSEARLGVELADRFDPGHLVTDSEMHHTPVDTALVDTTKAYAELLSDFESAFELAKLVKHAEEHAEIWQWLVPHALESGMPIKEVLPYLDYVTGTWNQIPFLENVIRAYQEEGRQDELVIAAIQAAIEKIEEGFVTPQYKKRFASLKNAYPKPVLIVKEFGEYTPFTVAQFAEEAEMTTEEAAAILDELRLKGENIEMVRDAKGSIYYQYAPVRLVLQIGPDDTLEDIPPGVDTVLINHSETKEFLGARAKGSNRQIREFIEAGYKVVVAFGDFPEHFKGKDYLTLGLRSFPVTFDGIQSKLESLNDTDPLYNNDLRTLHEEAVSIRRSDLAELKEKYDDLIQALEISDDAVSLDDLKAKIIAELSTKAEIEREIRDLFKDLTPDEVLYNIYCRAYEPVEGIRTVAISPVLAKFRQDYIRQTMTDLVIGTGTDEATKTARNDFESKLRITYGGGGNVKNIVALGETGYRGAFIGRASAKPRAESGENSTANITEAAAESEDRMLTLYNTKSTETAGPGEYFDAYNEKGLDLARRVEAAHAVTILDFHIWRRARMGENVGHLFVDASDERLDVDITIRAGQAEATQGIGAFTRHHAAELLARAGVTQAVIDPTKDYAVTQVENLVSAGITPVILSSEHTLEAIESFKKRVDNIKVRVLDDVIIIPISEVRNAHEALLGEINVPETAYSLDELEQMLRQFSTLQAQI